MPYHWAKHTADVRLKVRGQTLAELFADALVGMMALVQPSPGAGRNSVVRTVTVAAPDRTALLVDFLNAALAQSQIHREAYREVVFKKLTKTLLTATLKGVAVDSFREDIKAVTYHEADVRRTAGGGWETTLVLDI